MEFTKVTTTAMTIGNIVVLDGDDVLLDENISIGEIDGLPVKIKEGRYGIYAVWGDNKCSLKYIKKNIENITIQDVLHFWKLKKNRV